MNSSSLRALHPIKFKLLYIFFFLRLLHRGFLLQTCSKPPIWNFRKWQPHSAWATQTCPNWASGRWLQKGIFCSGWSCSFRPFLPSHSYSGLAIILIIKKREPQQEGHSVSILASVPRWEKYLLGRAGRVKSPSFPLLPPRLPRCPFSEGCAERAGSASPPSRLLPTGTPPHPSASSASTSLATAIHHWEKH